MAQSTQFGSRLRARREQAGLSPDELATAIGVEAGVIRDWEDGIREPNLTLLSAVAGRLSTSVDRLLGAPVSEHDDSGEVAQVLAATRRVYQQAPREVRRAFLAHLWAADPGEEGEADDAAQAPPAGDDPMPAAMRELGGTVRSFFDYVDALEPRLREGLERLREARGSDGEVPAPAAAPDPEAERRAEMHWEINTLCKRLENEFAGSTGERLMEAASMELRIAKLYKGLGDSTSAAAHEKKAEEMLAQAGGNS